MKNKFAIMKKLITILLLHFCFTAHAKTYYVSNSGNDNNSGLATSTPWKTIAKVNSFTGLVEGDKVLFNRGELFYGKLIISKSGISGSPITIGAYGTGAKPVVTGFTSVIAWTNLGSNIWESTSAVSTLPYTNMVAINGVNTAMGRYPNTGYYYFQSHTTGTTNTITSSSLMGSPNWTGAELALFNTTFTIVRNTIIAQSGGTLTYKPLSTDLGFESDNLGFIIQNDPKTLDVQNEWYYNPSTKKLRVYSTSAPANVQLTTIDTLVYINGDNYITFDNISFQGSNKASMYLSTVQHITIQNCDFNFSGRDAIFGHYGNGNSTALDIENCTINNTNNSGINLYYPQFSNSIIRSNTVKNCGLLPGMGSNGFAGGGSGTYGGIFSLGANGLIELNRVDSVGLQGIWYYGNNTVVKNNFVSNFCLTLHDGGGIYTWNAGGPATTGMRVLNNIVLNGKDVGIYLDDNSNNIEIAGNTVANCNVGLYHHNSWNINAHDNTTFNNSIAGLYISAPTVSIAQVGNRYHNNIFFAKTIDQPCVFFDPMERILPGIIMDSNYYARPIAQTTIIKIFIRKPSFVATDKSLTMWQIYSGQETHSRITPLNIRNVDELDFKYNATSSPATISLGEFNYTGVKNKTYRGTITLAPYASVVLIKKQR